MSSRGFLIIGAQKAGTTTLYRDLYPHPEICLSVDKEPNALCDDEILTDAGRCTYTKLFSRAKPSQICGEASTRYSMLPDFPGVPGRARLVWGEELKIIYMVRNPIARIVSQHQYESSRGLLSGDLNDLIWQDDRFINYSNYAMQLEAWLDCFPREQIKVIQFEHYVKDRAAVVEDVCAFLGIEPRSEHIDEERVYNRSLGEPVAKGIWRRLVKSPFYVRAVKPAVPFRVRDTLRSALLPRATTERQELNEEAQRYVRDRLGLRSLAEADYGCWVARL